MPKNIIFYFSGTGNSLKAAKDIAAAVGGCELVNMGCAHRLDGAYERIGFVFPCYFWGIPARVRAFVNGLDISGNEQAYIFAAATFGGTGAVNALSQVDRLLERKGAALSYNHFVRMPGNYVCLYPMQKDAAQRAAAAEEAIRFIVSDIARTKRNSPPRGSFIMNFAYSLFIRTIADKDRGYNVSDACTGCGMCADVCPVGNIRIENGRPEFLHNCEQCMACIQWCPAQAINYKNKTQTRGRYHHPRVTAAEIGAFNKVSERINVKSGLET